MSSSAAVADGIIYIGNMDGTVYAFDEEDGGLLWSYAIPRLEYDEHNIFSSPAVADGIVYVQTYGENLYALDASTGSLLWTSLNENAGLRFQAPRYQKGSSMSGAAGKMHSMHLMHKQGVCSGNSRPAAVSVPALPSRTESCISGAMTTSSTHSTLSLVHKSGISRQEEGCSPARQWRTA